MCMLLLHALHTTSQPHLDEIQPLTSCISLTIPSARNLKSSRKSQGHVLSASIFETARICVMAQRAALQLH
jgi:hypothetical protein